MIQFLHSFPVPKKTHKPPPTPKKEQYISPKHSPPPSLPPLWKGLRPRRVWQVPAPEEPGTDSRSYLSPTTRNHKYSKQRAWELGSRRGCLSYRHSQDSGAQTQRGEAAPLLLPTVCSAPRASRARHCRAFCTSGPFSLRKNTHTAGRGIPLLVLRPLLPNFGAQGALDWCQREPSSSQTPSCLRGAPSPHGPTPRVLWGRSTHGWVRAELQRLRKGQSSPETPAAPSTPGLLSRHPKNTSGESWSHSKAGKELRQDPHSPAGLQVKHQAQENLLSLCPAAPHPGPGHLPLSHVKIKPSEARNGWNKA